MNHDAWVNRFARKVPGWTGPQSGGSEVKVDNPDEIVISMEDDDDDVLEPSSVKNNVTPVNTDNPTSNAASETVIAANNPDEIVMDDDDFDFDEPTSTPIINNDNNGSVMNEQTPSLHTPEAHDELINETTDKAPALEISNQGNIFDYRYDDSKPDYSRTVATKLPKLLGS